MTVYLSPIGYSSGPVSRALLSQDLTDGDVVILLRPDNTENEGRSVSAVKDVEQMLSTVADNIVCEVKQVSFGSYTDTMLEIGRLLENGSGIADRFSTANLDEESVVVCLAGGARDVTVPLAFVALLQSKNIQKAVYTSDIDGNVYPVSLMPVSSPISEPIQETLELLARNTLWKSETQRDWIMLQTLIDQSEKTQSSVSRDIKTLTDSGLVEARLTVNQQKEIKLTRLGEIATLLW